ncbi:hypothetical protein [Marinomonas polaris]|uniref:hypothetical protein n=1 Tax=Marinomonas polaris TaxID=293552 RepID=UPI003F963770
MQSSLSIEKLSLYLKSQLDYQFPDGDVHPDFNNVVAAALSKVKYCFGFVNLNHYYKNGILYFNHLNSDQYTVFVYYASNIAYEVFNDTALASKLFYLNKSLNQFHCMYDTKLPDIFVIIHSTGIVLGKAKYSDFLVVSHHCTVGANANLEYPTMDRFTIMYPYSSIIGRSKVSDNVCISNGSYVNNVDLPSGSLVFGSGFDLNIKRDKKVRSNYFFRGIEDEK